MPALRDLNGLTETALEEGDPIPPDALLEVAERQLRRIYSFAPVRFMVDSTSESEIVIYACPKQGHSILLALYPNGRALCSTCVPNGRFKKSCATVEDLTDQTLLQAARLLKHAQG